MGENKSEGIQGKDLVFIYPNDIRGKGFMLHYVSGVTGIEPNADNGLQIVHTTEGDTKVGIGYIRVAESSQ